MAEDVVRAFGFLCLGTRMKRIGERLQADTQKIMDEMGVEIAASQYPLLAAVDRLGPLAIGDLAEAMGVSQPGVTRSIAQLVDLGFLRAEPTRDDQRRKLVSLTGEGERLVDEAKKAIWPRIEAAVADLCGTLDGPLLEQLTIIEDGLAALPLNGREPKPLSKQVLR